MIREPAVAGQFYPGNPSRLMKDIEAYLGTAESPLDAKAVIAPHAGYVYSGMIAGAVIGAVRLPGRFIILGPNHTGMGDPLALAPAGEWRTPLGLAVIDQELNRRLIEQCPILREDGRAHVREHSIEVQIPFLQARMREFRFAAICVATANYSSLQTLGHALAEVIRSSPNPILIVCSSDMNHYESSEVADRKDRMAIDRILSLDPEGLYKVVRSEGISMCGIAPAVAALTASRELGATRGSLVRYGDSGDVSGDHSSVVGYAGLAIT